MTLIYKFFKEKEHERREILPTLQEYHKPYHPRGHTVWPQGSNHVQVPPVRHAELGLKFLKVPLNARGIPLGF